MKKLTKISLIITILGILILLIISNNLAIELENISEINTKHLNKNIKINGKILNLKNINKNFQIITIKDTTGTIQVITDYQTKLSKDQSITITGRVTQYKDSLQIQANKITL